MNDHPLTVEGRQLLAMQPEIDADWALLQLFERIKPSPEEFNAALVRVCQRKERVDRFIIARQIAWN